jgi:hypothetical protein
VDDAMIVVQPSYDEVSEIVAMIHGCALHNHFRILQNRNSRKRNRVFIRKYQLSVAKQRDILLRLMVEDFCKVELNTNENHPLDLLYFFCPTLVLDTAIDDEDKEDEQLRQVDIYIKLRIDVNDDGSDGNYMFVISFHEANPMTYAFQEERKARDLKDKLSRF